MDTTKAAEITSWTVHHTPTLFRVDVWGPGKDGASTWLDQHGLAWGYTEDPTGRQEAEARDGLIVLRNDEYTIDSLGVTIGQRDWSQTYIGPTPTIGRLSLLLSMWNAGVLPHGQWGTDTDPADLPGSLPEPGHVHRLDGAVWGGWREQLKHIDETSLCTIRALHLRQLLDHALADRDGELKREIQRVGAETLGTLMRQVAELTGWAARIDNEVSGLTAVLHHHIAVLHDLTCQVASLQDEQLRTADQTGQVTEPVSEPVVTPADGTPKMVSISSDRYDELVDAKKRLDRILAGNDFVHGGAFFRPVELGRYREMHDAHGQLALIRDVLNGKES